MTRPSQYSRHSRPTSPKRRRAAKRSPESETRAVDGTDITDASTEAAPDEVPADQVEAVPAGPDDDTTPGNGDHAPAAAPADDASAGEDVSDAPDRSAPLGDDDAYGMTELYADDLRAQAPRASDSYGPLESIARKPRAFILPVALLGTIGLVLGLLRQPVYTAEAQLSVGPVAGDFQPTEGQILALQDLTGIYSRLVGSADHMELVNATLGTEVPPGALTGAPVPASRLVRIEATGTSEEEAVSRADAAADDLRALVDNLQAEARADDALLDEYTAISNELAAAEIRLDLAEAEFDATPSQANREALIAAQSEVDTLALRRDQARSNFQASEAARGAGTPLTPFAAAESWGSDRRNQLVIHVFAGMLFGALVGAALATLAANRWRLIPTSDRPASGG